MYFQDKKDEGEGVVFEQKNKFCVGEDIEIMKPDGRNISTTVLSIQDKDGNSQESAPHSRQELHVRFTQKPEPGDILRRKNNEN